MPTFSLNSAGAMELALRAQVCVICKLRGRVSPEVGSSAIYHYLRFPAKTLRFVDAQIPTSIVLSGGALIRPVPALGDISKIDDPVVVSVAVNVINHSGWELPVGVEPCEPVRLESPSLYSDRPVPAHIATCNTSRFGAYAGSDAPRKNASFRVVVQQLFERALCKFRIVISHAVSPVKKWFGQRPARVISTGGLRYFITHACSGAMGITKCLHQAALAAASVCMPANHRRLSNPLGALTPFNAL